MQLRSAITHHHFQPDIKVLPQINTISCVKVSELRMKIIISLIIFSLISKRFLIWAEEEAKDDTSMKIQNEEHRNGKCVSNLEMLFRLK